MDEIRPNIVPALAVTAAINNEGILDPQMPYGFGTAFPSLTSFPSVRNIGVATQARAIASPLCRFALCRIRPKAAAEIAEPG
jgi:hypothetical protein